MKELEQLINKYWDTIVAHRRWLHAHPELSGQEKNTAAYIAHALRTMGLEPVEHVGGYGVTALIKGCRPGKCVGLRADFDALPITECTGLPFSSENPGVSHACGHDAHAAMLLGAAHVLNEMRHHFSGTVKLIFQPSEENSSDSGAKKMIADGVLENPCVDAIIGQHVTPLCASGEIMLRRGTMTAASDRFFITIEGKSSHASRPEAGVDAVVVGAQVVTALQNIVSRNISPLDNSVLTIGTVRAGTRYNVVADTCEMEGTCRNQNSLVRDSMPERIERIVKGVAEGMGARCSVNYVKGYTPLINHTGMHDLLVKTAADVIGAERIRSMEQPLLIGEDFSFYADRIPGIFFLLGCRREDSPFQPLHSDRFAPDEAALKTGTHLLTASALRFLDGDL